MVTVKSEGFKKELENARWMPTRSTNFKINLFYVGKSHPDEVEAPEDYFELQNPTTIVVSGIFKSEELVKQLLMYVAFVHLNQQRKGSSSAVNSVRRKEGK